MATSWRPEASLNTVLLSGACSAGALPVLVLLCWCCTMPGSKSSFCRLRDRARHVQSHDAVHTIQCRKQGDTHPERQEFCLLGAGLLHDCVHFCPGVGDLLKLLQHLACLLSLQASSSKAQVRDRAAILLLQGPPQLFRLHASTRQNVSRYEASVLQEEACLKSVPSLFNICLCLQQPH